MHLTAQSVSLRATEVTDRAERHERAALRTDSGRGFRAFTVTLDLHYCSLTCCPLLSSFCYMCVHPCRMVQCVYVVCAWGSRLGASFEPLNSSFASAASYVYPWAVGCSETGVLLSERQEVVREDRQRPATQSNAASTALEPGSTPLFRVGLAGSGAMVSEARARGLGTNAPACVRRSGCQMAQRFLCAVVGR
jgi:hypothetical protein